jgi:hypothetical protein
MKTFGKLNITKSVLPAAKLDGENVILNLELTMSAIFTSMNP